MSVSELEQLFHGYLLRRGFPADAIVAQPLISGHEHFDFAVVDKNADEVLALFDIKGRIHDRPINEALSQLARHTQAFSGHGIPVYLVIAANSPTFDAPFQFYRARNDGSIEEIPKELFPTYETLRATKPAVKKEELKREQRDNTDAFQRICSYVGILCLSLIGLDIYGAKAGWKFEILTAQRITLLGAAIALFLIPYAQKIKALGFEYEKAASRKNDPQ